MLTSDRAARLTDADLVTLTLDGVQPAFACLLDRHAMHLLRVVTGRLRNREDVLDVLQEIRLAIWRALHRYDAGRPFAGWITSIALNKCTDWSRHRAVEASLQHRLQVEVDARTTGENERSAEAEAMAEEGARALIQALDGLPARLREALVLTSVLSLRQSQAARELGVTRKTVEMRLRRARRHLARALPA